MRKIVFAMLALCITGCTKEYAPNDNAASADTSHIRGIWECGEYYLAISENELRAYIADDFIDNGEYEYKNNAIICYDRFFDRTTQYTITEIGNNLMSLSIDYVNYTFEEKHKELTFVKRDTNVPRTSLVGHSISRYLGSWGDETITFCNEYYALMKCSAHNDFALDVHYVFRSPYIYYQSFNPAGIRYALVGGWGLEVDTGYVRILELKFEDGHISGYKDITTI